MKKGEIIVNIAIDYKEIEFAFSDNEDALEFMLAAYGHCLKEEDEVVTISMYIKEVE